MSNIGPALEILWRHTRFLGAGWGDGAGGGRGNNMVILMTMEGSGRGPACAFETSTTMWGSIVVRLGCRPSYLVSILFNLSWV